MGVGYVYSEKELHKLDRDDLERLASYFKLVIPKGTTKAELVTMVIDAASKQQEMDFGRPELPRYSVRLQRIMDSMKKEA